MIPSDHFVRFYNEVFKFLESCGGKDALLRYYERISANQEAHCLDMFKARGLRGMFEYWERIRVEENCDMTNRVDKDCYSFTFHRCPSLGKVLDNDASPCAEYCRHCPGWIMPIMTKAGFFAVYNLVDCAKPQCEMYVFSDIGKARAKAEELRKNYGGDMVVANFSTGEGDV
jgi:hypothetical protein